MACLANPGGFETTTILVGDVTLTVAVADSVEERRRGLSGLTDLGELDGMIFIFPEPRPVTFTMRDTLIPLDISFFDPSGTLVSGTTMTPCPAEPCPGYHSAGVVGYVLETAAGRFVFEPGARLVLADGD